MSFPPSPGVCSSPSLQTYIGEPDIPCTGPLKRSRSSVQRTQMTPRPGVVLRMTATTSNANGSGSSPSNTVMP